MRYIISLIVVSLSLAVIGCRPPARDEATAEADDAVGSSAVAGDVYLSAEARGLLALQIEPTRRIQRVENLLLTGWLVPKPGSENVIHSPATGFYRYDEQHIPSVGDQVSHGASMGAIRVVFTLQERAQLVIAKEEADMLIEQSRVSMEIAATQLAAIRKTSGEAVAGIRLRELEEIVERARVAQREAQQKLPFLPTEPYGESLGMPPMAVTAGVSGTIVDVHVQPNLFVMQGDPLWSVAEWSTLWIRVPVFTGDLSQIDHDKPCGVSTGDGSPELSAQPIETPIASEPGRRTIDVFFELHSTDGTLRPGQPVEVRLVKKKTPAGISSPKNAKDELSPNSLVVSRSAILWDTFGNAWVYVATATDTDTFRRQRVEVGPTTGDDTVIERGLHDADRIVTQGAAALYAEEFKGRIPLDDDD